MRVLHVGAEPPRAKLVEDDRGVNEEANEKETDSRLASRSSFQHASRGKNLQKHDRNSNPTGSRRARHDHDKRNDDKRRLHNVDDEEEFRAQRATATLDNARDFEDEVDEEHDDDDAQEGLDPADGQLGVVLAPIVLDFVGVRDDDAELEAEDAEADNHDKHAQDPKGDEDALEKGRRLLADVGGRHGGGWVGVGCDGFGEESGGAECRKACLHWKRGSMSERRGFNKKAKDEAPSTTMRAAALCFILGMVQADPGASHSGEMSQCLRRRSLGSGPLDPCLERSQAKSVGSLKSCANGSAPLKIQIHSEVAFHCRVGLDGRLRHPMTFFLAFEATSKEPSWAREECD